MKGKFLAIAAAVVTAGLLLTGTMVAASTDKDDMWSANKTVKESEVIDGTYYAAGQTVTVAGTVKGDVYCAGKSVIVTGTVEGDVLCAGQTVKVSGKVGGDVRLAGQSVTVDGTIAKSASLAGATIDITKSGNIGQDITAAGETVTISGKVARDMWIGGTSATITGTIGRHGEVASEDFTVSDGAIVQGNVHYKSRHEASIAEGSVKGKVDFTKQTDRQNDSSSGASFASSVYMGLALLFMSLIFVLAAPNLMNNLGIVGRKKLGMTIVAGLILLLAGPLLLVLVGITVIGIPLAIALALAWILLLLVSGPVTAYYIGRLVSRKYTSNAVASMMIGAVILAILLMIPVVNVIAGIASTVLGTGMVVLHAFGTAGQKKFSYTIK